MKVVVVLSWAKPSRMEVARMKSFSMNVRQDGSLCEMSAMCFGKGVLALDVVQGTQRQEGSKR